MASNKGKPGDKDLKLSPAERTALAVYDSYGDPRADTMREQARRRSPERPA